MHNSLHTARPHTCTRKQRQSLRSRSSSSRNNSSGDSDNKGGGIAGNWQSFAVAIINNFTSAAFAAACQVRQLFDSCSGRYVSFP
jgi:hypothetical protein